MIGNDDPVAVPGAVQLSDDSRGATTLPPQPRIPSPRVAPDSVGFGSPSSLVENRLRGKLVDRLTLMAVRHCRHREEQQRTRRAVGPHALGFFFADAAPNGSGEIEVVTATRLFFDNDDNADTSNLIAVLDMLIERASEYSPGTFEPRTHMCNRVEEMPATAELVGIGITTVFRAADHPWAISRGHGPAVQSGGPHAGRHGPADPLRGRVPRVGRRSIHANAECGRNADAALGVAAPAASADDRDRAAGDPPSVQCTAGLRGGWSADVSPCCTDAPATFSQPSPRSTRPADPRAAGQPERIVRDGEHSAGSLDSRADADADLSCITTV